jgi:hypothetical protein
MYGGFRLGVLAVVAAAALAAAGGSSGSSRGCVARLTIVSPSAGDTVRMPFPVHYRVSCFKIGAAPAGHIELVFGSSRVQRIVLKSIVVGIASVPRDPRLPGRRTLLLRLARADRTLLANPEARATVGPLSISGPR